MSYGRVVGLILLCAIQFVSSLYIPPNLPLSEDNTINDIPIEEYLESLKRLNEVELARNNVHTNRTLEEYIDRENASADPMMSPYMFQGDILLSKFQLKEMLCRSKDKANKTNASIAQNPLLRNFARLWKMPIPYYYESVAGGINLLKQGMKMWTDNTCVRFEELSSIPYGRAFLRVKASGGCFASWGYHGNYAQHVLSLGNGCGRPGIAAHELGHTLGLYHTQSRTDRGNYIHINYNYIDSSQSYNFNVAPEPSTTLDVPYDYGSVMHYPATSFAIYYGYTTVVTKDRRYQNTIGYREDLSFYDIKIINLAYCNNLCSTELDCLHNGYTDPLDCSKCRCPSGFSGTYCEEVQKTTSNCGQIEFEASSEYQTVSFKGVGKCNFFIKGNGHKVQLILERYPSATPVQQLCEYSYLEVKYKEDLGLTGARFCGRNDVRTIPFNDSSETVMLIYKGNNHHHQFSVKFKTDGPLILKPTTTSTPATSTSKSTIATTQPTSTTTTTTTTTSATTTTTTQSTTTKMATTATTTTTTTRKPTTTTRKATTTATKFRNNWSHWSHCSHKCGGCGTRQRYNWYGTVQTEYCNTAPCPGPYCCRPYLATRFGGRWFCLKSIYSDSPSQSGEIAISSNPVKYVIKTPDPESESIEGSGTGSELTRSRCN